MRAICEINPLDNANRPTRWIDVSERVTGTAKIRRQFRSSQWSYGVAAVSFGKLSLENSDGMFSPPADYRSVFRNSPMGHALFRVRYGGTADAPERQVFAGTVSSRTSESASRRDVATLTVKSIGSVLQAVEATELKLAEAADRVEVLDQFFAIPEVNRIVRDVDDTDARQDDDDLVNTSGLFGFRPDSDSPPVNLPMLIKPELVREGDSLLEVLNRFLQVEDALFLYNYRRRRWIVTRRGVMPSQSVVYLEDVLDVVEDSDGTRDVVNEVVLTPPLEFYKDNTPPLSAFYDAAATAPASLTLRNPRSIAAHGVNSVSIDCRFLSKAYFYNRVYLGFRSGAFAPQRPRRRVKILADLDQRGAPGSPGRIDEDHWGLGEYVYLDPKPPSDAAVPVVADDRPVSPVSLERDLFDPSVGADGIGVLMKVPFASLFDLSVVNYNAPSLNILIFADVRALANNGVVAPIRRSSDGSLPPGYLGRVRIWRRGNPGFRPILLPSPVPDSRLGQSGGGGLLRSGNVRFQDSYFPDLRMMFRIRGTVHEISMIQTGTTDRNNQQAALAALVAAMDAGYPNPAALEPDSMFAIVDAKARNISPTDPTRVIISSGNRGDRLPLHVAGQAGQEDVTRFRRAS